MVPVLASNRVGTEVFPASNITFYGSSFITDFTGGIIEVASQGSREVLLADVDIEAADRARAA
eukprot:CAMPEP_0198439478 /NCGR_PEP_ID=MMETSP1452-20131203/55172_1 /TAXON_ID=1181717 /ORGANISM="Synchroma pusillum, Strain CCMP3072" /LENGTH=62 /DNA_ID=CAMNT_0044160083 /DNA_START=1 /DNA_END=186 /DNA_ORIENTATION=-